MQVRVRGRVWTLGSAQSRWADRPVLARESPHLTGLSGLVSTVAGGDCLRRASLDHRDARDGRGVVGASLGIHPMHQSCLGRSSAGAGVTTDGQGLALPPSRPRSPRACAECKPMCHKLGTRVVHVTMYGGTPLSCFSRVRKSTEAQYLSQAIHACSSLPLGVSRKARSAGTSSTVMSC